MPAAAPDYIIVGAGSTGCVLANRLSANASVRVLLLEAGESGERDPMVTTPGRWLSLLGSSYDWRYATEPEPALDRRIIAAPRGRALGGSSAINAMAYIRGHRRAFDRWRDAAGSGWGYDGLRPYFERAEQGPLVVSECRDPHAGHEAFLDAAAALGFGADRHHDFTRAEPEGVAGFYRKNIVEGRRQSAASAYLVPVLHRPNLEVRTLAHVTRLVVERGRVRGVEYTTEGRVERIDAAREVVLCAGAVDSPLLLMRSGIGAGDRLRRLGIGVVLDRPGVGANLHDHLKLSIRWRARQPLAPSSVTAGLFTSTPGAPVPDLQFYIGRGLDQPDPFVTITVSHVQPASRGRIELASSDPARPPVIRAGYLDERRDLEALLDGLRLARAFGATAAYRGLIADEIEPGGGIGSAIELERFVRQQADTIFHLAGTCRMGPASDPLAVVDAALKVHGLDGLRVADASIMPQPVNAPTHAACVAIGEKVAEML